MRKLTTETDHRDVVGRRELSTDPTGASINTPSTVLRATVVSSDVDLDQLARQLPDLGLVVVRSADFSDGRLFSLGVALRQRLGYHAELHATGDILPDQVPLLYRCGFDCVDVSDSSVAHYPGYYQSAAPDRGSDEVAGHNRLKTLNGVTHND